MWRFSLKKQFLSIKPGTNLSLILLLSISLVLAACGDPTATTTAGVTTTTGAVATTTTGAKLEAELNIYSWRREDLFKPVVDAFTAKTGVKVNVKYGSGELASAAIEEKGNPRADLLVGSDAATAENLRLQGVLAPSNAVGIDKIPAEFRATDGSWVGLSARTRIIQYNKTLVKESDLPKSIFELTDPKWKGKVAMHNSGDASLIPQITAIRLLKGEETARKFLKDMLANDVKILKSSTDIRKAVGKGEVALGFTNHYYYHLELQDGSPVGIIYPDQGANDLGAFVNAACVSFINGAKNPNAARAFIEFMVSNDAQKIFAENNFEYPLLPGVKIATGVKPLTEIKRTDIVFNKLSGKEIENTRKLFDEVGWQ
jgi:iron(III) transport system substrate-binding protein